MHSKYLSAVKPPPVGTLCLAVTDYSPEEANELSLFSDDRVILESPEPEFVYRPGYWFGRKVTRDSDVERGFFPWDVVDPVEDGSSMSNSVPARNEPFNLPRNNSHDTISPRSARSMYSSGSAIDKSIRFKNVRSLNLSAPLFNSPLGNEITNSENPTPEDHDSTLKLFKHVEQSTNLNPLAKHIVKSSSTDSISNKDFLFEEKLSVEKRTVPIGSKVIVLFQYTANKGDELSLNMDDIILISNAPRGGWWKGKIISSEQSNGNVGWFPCNFVEVVSEPEGPDPDNPDKNDSRLSFWKKKHIWKSADEKQFKEGISERRHRSLSEPQNMAENNFDNLPPLPKLNNKIETFPPTNPNTGVDLLKEALKKSMGNDKSRQKSFLGSFSALAPEANPYRMPPKSWKESMTTEQYLSLQPKEIKRHQLVWELFITEGTYIRDLKMIVEIFLKPLSKKNITSPKNIEIIFRNIEKIFLVNKDFYQTLDAMYLDNIIFSNFGTFFLKSCEAFSVYSEYCRNNTKALDKLSDLAQSNRAFRQFLQESYQQPATRHSDLSSYLLRPIQRIEKYPLLLMEIMKNTPSHHPDKKNLEISIAKLQNIRMIVKEGIDGIQKMHEIQKSFAEKLSLISQTRYLVLEEDLNIASKSETKPKLRHIFFFNDLVLIAKKDWREKFHLIERADLKNVRIMENFNEYQSEEIILDLVIRHQQESAEVTYLLYPFSQKQKDDIFNAWKAHSPSKNKNLTPNASAISLPKGEKKPIDTPKALMYSKMIAENRKDKDLSKSQGNFEIQKSQSMIVANSSSLKGSDKSIDMYQSKVYEIPSNEHMRSKLLEQENSQLRDTISSIQQALLNQQELSHSLKLNLEEKEREIYLLKKKNDDLNSLLLSKNGELEESKKYVVQLNERNSKLECQLEARRQQFNKISEDEQEPENIDLNDFQRKSDNILSESFSDKSKTKENSNSSKFLSSRSVQQKWVSVPNKIDQTEESSSSQQPSSTEVFESQGVFKPKKGLQVNSDRKLCQLQQLDTLIASAKDLTRKIDFGIQTDPFSLDHTLCSRQMDEKIMYSRSLEIEIVKHEEDQRKLIKEFNEKIQKMENAVLTETNKAETLQIKLEQETSHNIEVISGLKERIGILNDTVEKQKRFTVAKEEIENEYNSLNKKYEEQSLKFIDLRKTNHELLKKVNELSENDLKNNNVLRDFRQQLEMFKQKEKDSFSLEATTYQTTIRNLEKKLEEYKLAQLKIEAEKELVRERELHQRSMFYHSSESPVIVEQEMMRDIVEDSDDTIENYKLRLDKLKSTALQKEKELSHFKNEILKSEKKEIELLKIIKDLRNALDRLHEKVGLLELKIKEKPVERGYSDETNELIMEYEIKYQTVLEKLKEKEQLLLKKERELEQTQLQSIDNENTMAEYLEIIKSLEKKKTPERADSDSVHNQRRVEDLNSIIESHEDSITRLHKEKSNIFSLLEKEKEIVKEQSRKIGDFTQVVEKVSIENEELKEKCMNLTRDISGLVEEIREYQNDIKCMKAENSSLDGHVQQMEQDIDQFNKDKEQSIAEYEKLYERNQTFKRKTKSSLNNFEDIIIDIQNILIGTAKEVIQRAEDYELKSKEDDIKEQFGRIQEKLKNIEANVSQMTIREKSQNDNLRDLQDRLSSVGKELTYLREKEIDYKSKQENLRSLIAEKDSFNKKIEVNLNELEKNLEFREKAHEAEMNELKEKLIIFEETMEKTMENLQKDESYKNPLIIPQGLSFRGSVSQHHLDTVRRKSSALELNVNSLIKDRQEILKLLQIKENLLKTEEKKLADLMKLHQEREIQNKSIENKLRIDNENLQKQLFDLEQLNKCQLEKYEGCKNEQKKSIEDQKEHFTKENDRNVKEKEELKNTIMTFRKDNENLKRMVSLKEKEIQNALTNLQNSKNETKHLDSLLRSQHKTIVDKCNEQMNILKISYDGEIKTLTKNYEEMKSSLEKKLIENKDLYNQLEHQRNLLEIERKKRKNSFIDKKMENSTTPNQEYYSKKLDEMQLELLKTKECLESALLDLEESNDSNSHLKEELQKLENKCSILDAEKRKLILSVEKNSMNEKELQRRYNSLRRNSRGLGNEKEKMNTMETNLSEAFLKLESHVQRNEMLNFQIETMEKEIHDLQELKEAQKTQLVSLTKKLEENNVEKNVQRTELNAVGKRLEEKNAEIESLKITSKIEVSAMQQKLDSKNKEIEMLAKNIENKNAEFLTMQMNLRQELETNNNLKMELEQLKEHLKKKSKKTESLLKENSSLVDGSNKKLEALKKELELIKKDVDSKETRIQSLSAEKMNLENNLKEAEDQKKRLKEKFANYLKAEEEKRDVLDQEYLKKFESTESHIQTLEKKIAGLEKSLDQEKEKCTECEEEIKVYKEQIFDLKSEISKLEEEKENLLPLQSEIRTLHTEMANQANNFFSELEKERNEKEQYLKQKAQIAQQFENQTQNLHSELEALRRKSGVWQNEIKKLQSNNLFIRRESKRELENLSSDISNLQKNYADAIEEKQSLNEQLKKDLERKVNDLTKSLHEFQTRVEFLTKEQNDLHAQLQKIQNEKNDLNEELKKRISDNSVISVELKKVKEENTQINKELKKMQLDKTENRKNLEKYKKLVGEIYRIQEMSLNNRELDLNCIAENYKKAYE